MIRFKVKNNRLNFIFIVVFVSVLFTNSFLFSQQVKVSDEEKAEKLKLQQEILRYKELELKLLEEAFEGTIDPESYIVGPGDYYSVVIWGIEKGFHLPVTPEGMLIVPTVGQLKVDGLSLKQLQKAVKEAAMRKYKQAVISTNLMVMRKLRVYITGEVFDPSTYIATPIDRVSDLIYRAGGLKRTAYLQKIRIKHLNGSVTIFDFSSFSNEGDLSQNPFVKGGDIIVVPAIDYAKPVVKVEGNVGDPGFYPLKKDESIYNFLNRHHLISQSQKLSQILIKRDNDFVPISLLDSIAHEFLLEKNDIVIIPIDIQKVYVTGAVQQPGVYPFIANLRAKDYVGQAGVTDNAGGLKNIKVTHVSNGKYEKGADATIHAGDVIEVPIRSSKRFAEYLQIASQLATLLIAYFAIKQ